MASVPEIRSVRSSTNRPFLPAALLVVFAVALKFLIHYALPYFAFNRAYFDVYWPHRFRLITHISGGIVALICGPFQFWTGLRQRAITFHRWTGRLYLVGVVVGTSGAAMMAVFTTPRNFGISLGFMALAWITCTVIAYLAIRRRLMTLHKEWMVRSYVIAFGFVAFRLINDYPPGIHWGSFADRAATVTWACWGVPFLAYEIILAAQRLRLEPVPRLDTSR